MDARTRRDSQDAGIESRYPAILDSIDEGFCIIEVLFDEQERPVDYRFLELNSVFEQQTGLVDARNKRIRQFAPELEQFWFDTYGAVARTSVPIRFEHQAAQLRREFDVFAFPMQGEGDHMVGVIFRDITERKRREQELRNELTAAAAEAEAASRAKSMFMAMMSHELRTPLNAIIGFTSVLIDELPGKLNAEQHSQLAIVQRASMQLLDLVAEVLDLSHIEAGSLALAMQPVALGSLLREQVDQITSAASSRGLGLFTEVVDDSLVVHADRARLGQVIRNLLSNALKFTDEGSVTLRAQSDGEFVTIAVEDTGIGIPGDQIARLFQPFQRVQSIQAATRPGTGLGLSISKRLIEAMGGEVGIESQPGRGTRIWCTVPCARG